jgi:AraC family transcriptional regulator, regulatory protein of adaptative response / DNA-3-methyladenine glycosylase II
MSENRERRRSRAGIVVHMAIDGDIAYRAVQTRDARFDGQFFTAVRTTHVYCRPGCPARTPLRHNVEFYRTSAAAQAAGYRACRRCLPDAAPGSPEWNLRADTVGAAMRLIADGVVDREGIPGLAARVGYTPRHLNRLLTTEVGASPLALARARRANTARILLTTTSMTMTDISAAAGFSSLRQFNETVREVYHQDPTTLRTRHSRRPAAPGSLTLRLTIRTPFDTARLLTFLAARAVPGVERVDGFSYTRAMRLPTGAGVVRLVLPQVPDDPIVHMTLHLEHLGDLVPAVDRCRRLMDADSDPERVDELLAADPALESSVREHPGTRVPGAVDGPEILVRALMGQQISVAAARTALHRLTMRVDDRLPSALLEVEPGITHQFPTPGALAGLLPTDIPGPARRAHTIINTSALIDLGQLVIDSGCRTVDLTEQLVALPGIGPWTAGYLAMRVIGDPDILLVGDLAMRAGAARLGLPDDRAGLTAAAERWRPFRSYAGVHLWSATTRTAAATPTL